MSLRALLAAQQSGPSHGGDPIAAMLRPDLPLMGTYHATPDTAAGVVAQIDADRQAALASGAKPAATLYKLVLAPGVYRDSVPCPSLGWVVGETGNPADVIVTSNVTGGGTWHWWGEHAWMEAITVKSEPNPDGEGPKYPLHATGGGCLTLNNVVLWSDNPSAGGGPAVLGLDGGDHLCLTLYRCTLRNRGGALTNIHGAPANTQSVTMAFIDCTAAQDPREVGYGAMGASTDTLYLVGGNLTPGVMGGGATVRTDGWTVPQGGISAHHRLWL